MAWAGGGVGVGVAGVSGGIRGSGALVLSWSARGGEGGDGERADAEECFCCRGSGGVGRGLAGFHRLEEPSGLADGAVEEAVGSDGVGDVVVEQFEVELGELLSREGGERRAGGCLPRGGGWCGGRRSCGGGDHGRLLNGVCTVRQDWGMATCLFGVC